MLHCGNSLRRLSVQAFGEAVLDIHGRVPEKLVGTCDFQSLQRPVSHGGAPPGGDRMNIRQRVAPADAMRLCLIAAWTHIR